jgi:hypothetical protein
MPMFNKPAGNPGMQREAKMQALQEILQMLGDLEAEPFMPKDVKAVKIDVMAKKPMGDMEGMEMPEAEGMEKPEEEENGLELEAKGANIEELKKKLAMLLK